MKDNSSFHHKLLSALKPYRGKLVIGLSAAALTSALEVVGPMLLRAGVNALQDAKPVGWLYAFSGLIILTSFISGIFRFLMRYLVIGISRWVESDIRENFFGHLLGLSPSFFDRNLTGDLMARATDDIERVRMVLGPATQMSVATLLTLIFSAVMMFYLDSTLAMLVLLLAPLIGGVVLAVAKKLHRTNLEQQKAYGKLEARVQENLTGIRIIKSFVREDYESSRFADTCRLYFKRSMDVVKVQSLFMPILTMLIGLGVAGILYVGGIRVASGVIRLGDFIAFMSYLSLITWPMIALGWITHLYQRGKASEERLDEILSVKEQFKDDVGSGPDEFGLEGNGAVSVVFNDIHFRYRVDEPDIFKGLNLTIPGGSTLAIVGRTGSGKSTLVRLLTRLYEPQHGEILLGELERNGIHWNKIRIDDLRRMIGYVDQTPFLFSATIRENICFGQPEATDEEIENAARMACFDTETADFPDGYGTRIGERGVTLSGGQQQRMTIARALLIKPSILVLDDALSAVDTSTEAEIINNLSANQDERTVLFITHRLAAAERADSIAVLEDGRIIELGCHDELMKLKGVYAAMYHRQRLADELGAIS
ncbi:ABC transporter ATP-binding protein [bacterium]|nr:ABC transporter ATP-binding protein [bacterium]